MSIRNISFAAAVAGALTAITGTAQAAPLSGATAELKAQADTNVEKAAYRRCWIRHGIRHCRWVGYYDDDYGYYGYGGPYYGYGPGIGLYFGGRGGHFGGGHFHGHHR